MTLNEDIEVNTLAIGRVVDLDLNGKTLAGNLIYHVPNNNGYITLGSGTLNGNLTVDTPEASFINNAAVAGTTTIEDVANATFTNNGSIQSLVINDANGTRFVNGNEASVGEITIAGTGDGEVRLEGELGTVEITRDVTITLTGSIDTLKVAENVTAIVNGEGTIDTIEGKGTVTGEILFKKAVDSVIGMIDALPLAENVTIEHKEEIEAARQAFGKLSETQQEHVINIEKLEAAEQAIQDLEEVPPYLTGDIIFKATENGNTRTTSGKIVNFYFDDKGYKVIDIAMGDGAGEFESKIGNITIKESLENEETWYRVYTDHEYYASKTQMWRVTSDSVDTSTPGTIIFDKTGAPYLKIESQQLYNWFIKN